MIISLESRITAQSMQQYLSRDFLGGGGGRGSDSGRMRVDEWAFEGLGNGRQKGVLWEVVRRF